MSDWQRRWPVFFALGVTAVLVGYLMVWLPNRNVGLSFIGVELGEWVKFLPEVRGGQIRTSRNFFYVPPIALGLCLALFTATWPNRWQTWLMRAFAVGVSLLAFPAVPAILDEPSTEWRLRLALIGLVVIVALLTPLLGRWPRFVQGLIVLCGVVGIVLPTWAFVEIRPIVAELLRTPVGIGPGVWLNLVGFGLLITAAVLQPKRRT
jgi:hypothetical protein